MVSFDWRKMRRLEKAYIKASEAQEDTFIFEGRPYVTMYAKYVVEYLKTQLSRTMRIEV
jgi:hypothetical protein